VVPRRGKRSGGFPVPRSPSAFGNTHSAPPVAFSRPASPGFSHLSSQARVTLASDLRAAQVAEKRGVVGNTHSQQSRYWRWYLEYLHSIELDDNIFLEGFDECTQGRIIGAFAAAYRNLRFRPDHYRNCDEPVAKTCRSAIDAVGQTFRAFGHRAPGLDTTGKLQFFLQRQLRGYTNQDPVPKGQKALTPRILRALATLNDCAEATATHELLRGAFFFAMRSCEYLEVQGERRTKRLCIRNFRFYLNRRLLPFTSPLLYRADSVSVKFEFQKTDIRDENVTMHKSGDKLLCPVVA
jgi:hypothetical protein